MHCQYDSVVLGHFAELSHGFDDEPAAIALPKRILVMAISVVIGGEAVIQGDASPGREDFADGRTKIVREFDALADVADHGFALNGHRTG